jgi:hypothetical protein
MVFNTSICTKCYGVGMTTRYVVTSKTEGWLELRYTPREPQWCGCLLDTGKINDDLQTPERI